jgi:hypothetical protein
MANLGNALQELCEERTGTQFGTQLRLEKLDQLISASESLNGSVRECPTTHTNRSE